MAKEPKERVQVEGNLAAIARTRKIEPVDPTDPALSFMPPLASVDELTPLDVATPDPTATTSAVKADTTDTKPTAATLPEAPPILEPRTEPRSSPRSQRRSASAPAHVNKAESGDYTRVTLRLHNDVITRLVALGLPQKKRYTTLIEDYIMAGLERHKGG